MRRELVLVGVALALLVGFAARAAARAHRNGSPGWLPQVLVGLACGAIGAVAAVAPYADVVPDRFELVAAVVIGAMVLALVAMTVARRTSAWRRRRRREHARRASTTVALPEDLIDTIGRH